MAYDRTCFVIMPFGVKPYADGKMNFDVVFEEYIKKGIELAGFKPERADQSKEGGLINRRMMELIFHSRVAVVDITTNNPNVFYELGVRHALHKRGTVLIRRKTVGDMPFNISNMKVFEYEMDDQGRILTDPGSLAGQITAAVRSTQIDSLAYELLPDLRIDVRKTATRAQPKAVHYQLTEKPRVKIGFRTGDLIKVMDVDFWVNSENTMMQMARFYEQSISSTIRQFGAIQPDPGKPNFDDTIANLLRQALGERTIASDAEVLVTDPGLLGQTNNVKKLLHVASARGDRRRGWSPLEPISLLGDCVENAIRAARELIRRPDEPVDGRSLLIPLIGTGQARGEPDRICGVLVQSAIDALLEDPPYRNSTAGDLEEVLFLAYSESDEAMLARILFQLLQEDPPSIQAMT